MKKMNHRYIQLVIITAMALLLTSCKDTMTLDRLSNEPKLVVYCLPSTADTTYINVSRSIAVRNYNDNMRIVDIDNATITYTVNGQPQQVFHRDGGNYYVLARQNAGDRIAVSVSAPNLPDASGETVIPDTVAVKGIGLHDVRLFNSDYERSEDYYQLTTEFADPSQSRDYYAARVRLMTCADIYSVDDNYKYIVTTDTSYSYRKIYTSSEPIFNPITDIDDDFGFDGGFFGGLPIFSDAAINGTTYKLHINVDPCLNDYKSGLMIELLHLTPEFYHFLESFNSVNNSYFARHGMSQIMPTASNVRGGFGLIGGWNVSHTGYVRRPKNEY